MAELKDRIPKNPNRKFIIPEIGSPFYATIEYADNPLEEGTVVNKKNVLDTVYPESDDSSIGVQVLKAGIVNDPRWLPCEGQYISKSDYPILYDNLTAISGKVDFERNVRFEPPVPEFPSTSVSLYVKYKNYILHGCYHSSNGVYAYASFDRGKTWQATNMTADMIRHGSSAFVWDSGQVLVMDTYNDYCYFSADGINFTTKSVSGNSYVTLNPVCNKNGFVFECYYHNGTYGAVYSTDFGQTMSLYTNSSIFGTERTFLKIPNKSGALFLSPKTNLYYYIDAALNPEQVQTNYQLLSDTSQLDENYNIYTITSDLKLNIYSGTNYSLLLSKQLTATDANSVKIMTILNGNVYILLDGNIYRLQNLLKNGRQTKLEFMGSSDKATGNMPNDSIDTIYSHSEGCYHIVDTTYLPTYADNNELSKCYIKAM